MIEIEIKSLLGDEKNANLLIEKLKNQDSDFRKKDESKQLNHYFINGKILDIADNLKHKISDNQYQSIIDIEKKSSNYSVRTRQTDRETILVIKATVDDTNSSNGTARLENEIIFNDVNIDFIDSIVLKSGFSYQAKWSRHRKEYHYKDITVCIDKNAGYGYLAEFEKVVSRDENVDNVKQMIRNELEVLEIEELSQEKLAKMFDYYNKNWMNYYGTEKTFVIE